MPGELTLYNKFIIGAISNCPTDIFIFNHAVTLDITFTVPANEQGILN